ncbi:hypothetical protein HDU80_001157 [Chytriomyces hyalinus]|nr:hypothetical protein HDU80_001157 [Chytriomyces hyalinus]
MSWFFSAPSKAPIQTVSTTASPIATDPPAVPVKSKLELLAEFEQGQSAKRAVNTTVTVITTTASSSNNNTPESASMSSVDAPTPATNNVPVKPASTVTVETKKPSQGSTTTTSRKTVKKPSVDSTSSLKKPLSESVKLDGILDVKPKKPKSGTVAKSATKAAVPTAKKLKASKSVALKPDALPVSEAITMLPATEAVKETPKQLKRESRSKAVDPLSSETKKAATKPAKKKLVEPNSSPKPAKKSAEKQAEPTPTSAQTPPEVVPNPPQEAAATPVASVLPKKRTVRVQKTESIVKAKSLAKPTAPSAPALPIDLPPPAVETSLLPPVFVAQSEASESSSESDNEVDEDESDNESSSESETESQPIKIETPVAITAPIQLVQPSAISPVQPVLETKTIVLETKNESSSDDDVDDESDDSETDEEDVENCQPPKTKIQPSAVVAVAQTALPAKVLQPSITQSDSEDSSASENESSESEEEEEEDEDVDETADSINTDKPQYPNVIQPSSAINTKDESKSGATSAQPIQQAVESLAVESSSSEEEDESEADENDSEDVEDDEDEAEESSDTDVEENVPVAPPHSEIEAVLENARISPPCSEVEAHDQEKVEKDKPIDSVKAEHPVNSLPRDAPISMFTPKRVDNRPDIRFLQERARLPGFDYPFTFYKHPVETYRF